MATATTKAYPVEYEILDSWAKIDQIKNALLPLGFVVSTRSYRDDQSVDHTTVTFENPINSNRFHVELGDEHIVVVYDKGWLYNFTVAEALDKYQV